jgi:hypothetical protein
VEGIGSIKARERLLYLSTHVSRFNFASCVVDDKIFVIGGQRYIESNQSFYTREALSSVEVYDIKADQWSIGASTPLQVYNTCVGVVDNSYLYVCGTTEQTFDTNAFGYMFTSVFRMSLSTGEWTVISNDVTDITTNYRCVLAKINVRKLRKYKGKPKN